MGAPGALAHFRFAGTGGGAPTRQYFIFRQASRGQMIFNGEVGTVTIILTPP